jgi:predicted unusual protein kinase regulating ubiquinone biosynthesis (AarF/ABC1/UbiB family)
MDIIRLLGVIVVEYPRYLLSTNYDSSIFWNKCIRINTLYTKVLQAIAVHYISDTFYYHLNDIPYEKHEIPEIQHIIPKKIIGSGMISIVMEGIDANDKVYIVKAKRNGIDIKIIQGLQQIKNIVYWLQYLPFQFPIEFIFNQFEAMMVEQLSFENEIKHHKKFKENNSYNTNIIVPDIIDDYCTPTQIVMTKIEGSHFTNALSTELSNTYVKYITEMSSKNLILDGFIHSDLHAGNIIFTNDNKLGVIDFGLMIKLSLKERQSFFDLLKYLSMDDYNNAVTIVINNLLEPTHIKDSLTDAQLCELKQTLIELYVQIYTIQKAFSVKDICAIIQIVHKYKLTISNVFYKLMFFIVSCECFIHKLSPYYLHIFMDKIKNIFLEDEE